MALRCLLFSSDGGVADLICRVLADLGVDTDYCSEAVTAVEKVTNQSFQIVIIDWDKQPEAGLLLTTARDRKAAERPLTLAIVSNDVSVPKALQSGANSILRKPMLLNQVKDTLTTARDLLRAKQESAATAAAQAAAAGAAAGSSSVIPASIAPGNEKTLRAGEFLQSSAPAPSGQFVIESDPLHSLQTAPEAVDPLQDLEPVAASVAAQEPAPPPPTSETRGLEWYLKQRAGSLPPIPVQTAAPPAPAKPEIIGFDQTPSYSERAPSEQNAPAEEANAPSADRHSADRHSPDQEAREQKAAAELFAYAAGDTEASSQEQSRPGFALGKSAIVGALLLAACAVVAAPQAPWHPAVRTLWGRGQQAVHAWLNPQPVITAQAPESHENFARAGDEYKMPAAENIPDATTDPSQIRVVPVIDPTAKKPNGTGANADPAAGPADAAGTAPTDQTQTPATQNSGGPTSSAAENQPSAPPTTQPPSGPATSATGSLPPAAAEQTRPAAPIITQPAPPNTAPLNHAPPHYVAPPAHVPSSLTSQMASMTPDASGNKPVEAALPSIEPVAVSEAAERALLAEQPAIAFPASANGQQGTVILQVLIARDGTVQDAKFMQGSLAFARAAIDGVKQWKFKPYLMNGRAASVQTQLTMSFKPTS